MGKFFIPMYRYATTPYQTKRPQRGCNNYGVSMYDQPILFDAFMASLLGQLCKKSQGKCKKKDLVRKEQKSPWTFGVNLKGFHPEDISVKVKDGVVHISARQVEETEAGYDTFERFRKVPLPKDVDDEKLSCFSEENGKLILTAPYIEQKHINESSPIVDTSSPESKNESLQGESCKNEPEVTEITIKHHDIETSIEDNNQDSRTAPEQSRASADSINQDESQENGEKLVHKSKSDDRDETNTDLQAENAFIDGKDNFEKSEITSNQNSDERRSESPMMVDDKQKNQTEMKPVDERKALLNIRAVESEMDLSLNDSTMVKEIDGTKYFEMDVCLQGFTPDNTKIQWKNDALLIDAEQEVKTDSFVSYQKVHRKLSVPKSCLVEIAKAEMNKDGLLRITVPMKELQNES